MPKDTQPFTDNLGAPNDYQRPVATRTQDVDVFGGLSNVLNNFARDRNSSTSGQKDPLDQLRKVQDLRADEAKSELSIIKTGVETGDWSTMTNVIDSKLLEEIQKINELHKDDEMPLIMRDAMMEKAVLSIQAKYPDASDELESFMITNHIDHYIARNAKLQRELADQETDARLKALSEGFQYAIDKGLYDPEHPSYEETAQAGIARKKMEEDLALRLKEAQVTAAEVEASKNSTEAARAAAKARDEKAQRALLESTMTNLDALVGKASKDVYSLGIIASTDNTRKPEFLEGLQYIQRNMEDLKGKTLAAIDARGGNTDIRNAVIERFDSMKTIYDEWTKGDMGVVNRDATLLKILDNTNKLEAGQNFVVLNRLRAGLGTEVTQGIIEGTIPGFSKADTEAIRDQMIDWVNDGSHDIRNAHEAFLNYQAALNNPDIPSNPDPKKRASAIEAKTIGLLVSTSAFLPGFKESSGPFKSGVPDPTPETAKRLTDMSQSMIGLSLQETGPTMTLDNAEKLVGLIYNPKWRTAMTAAAKMSPDPEQHANVLKYDGVGAADVFGTVKSQYADAVEYDAVSKRFNPKVIPNPRGSISGPAYSSVDQIMGPHPEGARVATLLNKLLDHMEALHNDIGLVPEDALTLKGKDGTKEVLSVRDVFANSDDLSKSMENWAQNNPQDPNRPSEESLVYFDKMMKAIRDPEHPYYSMDMSSISSVSQTADSMEIRDQATTKYSGSTYVPVTGMRSYLASIGGTEAGGRRGAFMHYGENGASTAAGTYGFLLGKESKPETQVWSNTLIELDPDFAKLSFKERNALMANPVIEDAVMELFTKKNIMALRTSLGRDVSWEEVNMAHLLGSGGASDFIKAMEKNPNAKTKDVLPEKVIKANPRLTGSGEGTLLQMWNTRLNRNDPSFQQYMLEKHGIADAQVPSTDWAEGVDDDEINLPVDWASGHI